MKQYVERKVERVERTVVQITCDVCGKEKSFLKESEYFEAFNFITIHKNLGYGSISDGDILHIDLCEACFMDKLGTEFVLNHLDGDWKDE